MCNKIISMTEENDPTINKAFDTIVNFNLSDLDLRLANIISKCQFYEVDDGLIKNKIDQLYANIVRKLEVLEVNSGIKNTRKNLRKSVFGNNTFYNHLIDVENSNLSNKQIDESIDNFNKKITTYRPRKVSSVNICSELLEYSPMATTHEDPADENVYLKNFLENTDVCLGRKQNQMFILFQEVLICHGKEQDVRKLYFLLKHTFQGKSKKYNIENKKDLSAQDKKMMKEVIKDIVSNINRDIKKEFKIQKAIVIKYIRAGSEKAKNGNEKIILSINTENLTLVN